jgi:acyl carrier protein
MTEKKVAKIWKKALNLENKVDIRITDNFYKCGGSSLLFVQVITNIKKELDFDLELKNVDFKNVTIKNIAAIIDRG